VYSLLCSYCGDERHCSLPISILSEQLGTSEEVVVSALEFLEQKGIIERKQTEPHASSDIYLLDVLYEEQCIAKGLFSESEFNDHTGKTIRITDSINRDQLFRR